MRVFLFGLLALFLSFLSPALADEAKMNRTLSVTGHGEVRVVPDMASISMGVASFESTAKAAMDDNSATMTKLLQLLKESGINERDVMTSNFSVNPRYDYAQDNSRPPLVTGYDVSNSVTIVVRKLADLGSILDKGINTGSNQAYGLSFSVAKPEPHLDEARKLAVMDARKKAEVLAAAAGVTLGQIVSIGEGGGYQAPVPMYAKAAADSADAVPIAAGDMVLAGDVTVVWEMK